MIRDYERFLHRGVVSSVDYDFDDVVNLLLDDPINGELYMIVGMLYLNIGDFQNALSSVLTAFNAGYFSDDCHLIIAWCYMRLKRYDSAVITFGYISLIGISAEYKEYIKSSIFDCKKRI